MPRKARVLVPDCPHHIVQRGHNRQVVFLADEDYQFYLDNLKEWKARLGIQVYAWCLMTNHIHLVLQPGENARAISELMKRLAGRQAAFVNKQERRSGSLWEGRYKASPIQRDAYLLACCRYVEMNPVRASMVDGPRQYLWSSYRERMGLVNRGILDAAPSYIGLAEDDKCRRARYQAYLKQGASDQEIRMLRSALSRNQLTGNSRFIDEIERRIGKRIEFRGQGKPPKSKSCL